MWPNPQESTDFVTFTEEILNGKLRFLCTESVWFKEYWDCYLSELEVNTQKLLEWLNGIFPSEISPTYFITQSIKQPICPLLSCATEPLNILCLRTFLTSKRLKKIFRQTKKSMKSFLAMTMQRVQISILYQKYCFNKKISRKQKMQYFSSENYKPVMNSGNFLHRNMLLERN